MSPASQFLHCCCAWLAHLQKRCQIQTIVRFAARLLTMQTGGSILVGVAFRSVAVYSTGFCHPWRRFETPCASRPVTDLHVLLAAHSRKWQLPVPRVPCAIHRDPTVQTTRSETVSGDWPARRGHPVCHLALVLVQVREAGSEAANRPTGQGQGCS